MVGRDVSSRYARRTDREYERIASYIRALASGHRGNYLVFFPSYKVMQEVYEKFLGEFAADEMESTGNNVSLLLGS